MTDWSTHPLRAILDRLRDIERREWEERQALLKEHWAKFGAERQSLAVACVAAGGHDWRTPPRDWINAPHLWCPWCDARWPFDQAREGAA